jgi:hypothetical protein
MRFELFLTELPKASPGKVQDALSELPKGASTGTVLKAMEARKVPTVSVAWSDDKRVLNEVMDTLVELGAGVKLVDHGSLAEKLATFVAEKAGRARYIEDDDDPESRKFIKLGQAKKGESIGEALTRHTLTYFLQLCLAGVLFVWFAALRVGMERIFTTPQLLPEFVACALGLLVAYVATNSVRSVQAGRTTVARILPQMIAGGVLTLASLFFLGDGSAGTQVADGKVKRPPSLPYSGLLTELRRRKLAEEATGREGSEDGEASEAELAALAEEEADLPWCEKPGPVEEAVCEGGRAWEDALACLGKPEVVTAVKKPRAQKKRVAIVAQPEVAAEELEPVADTSVEEQPWGVTLGLATVIALGMMWLLSLLGLFLQLRVPKRAVARSPVDEAGPASTAEAANVAPEATIDHATVASLERERATLQEQLAETKAELAQTRVEAEQGPLPDNLQIASLQRELGLSRGALGANQLTISELKRTLVEAEAREAELNQLVHELSEAAQQHETAHLALLEMNAKKREAGRSDNDGGGGNAGGERNTGLTRQLPSSADDSSYSVNQVQEERVVLGKRRRP